MKGIVLAGGAGTRLFPASLPISKILLPIYDKPMIYYPISILMMAGIKDILIISNPVDLDKFKNLLGDGSKLGVKFSYAVQYVPKGIADSFLIAEDFIKDDSVALVLGDNLFHGDGFDDMLKDAVKNNKGATVFGYKVPDPERFGVVDFDENGNALSLEEKPKNPKSNYAVTGLYFYDNNVVEYAKQLQPSARGELEITDLNKIYLEKGTLSVKLFKKGFAWLDTGTFESLLEASNFVRCIEKNKGEQIACLEEIAYQEGFINKEQLLESIADKKSNDYYDYIKDIVE